MAVDAASQFHPNGAIEKLSTMNDIEEKENPDAKTSNKKTIQRGV